MSVSRRVCYARCMNSIEYLRQFRFAGFAIFDFAVSFLGMWLLAPWLSRGCRKVGVIVPQRNWVVLTIPLSIIAHILVGRITPFTKEFLDPTGFFLVKMLVFTCCVFGVLGIHRVNETEKRK